MQCRICAAVGHALFTPLTFNGPLGLFSDSTRTPGFSKTNPKVLEEVVVTAKKQYNLKTKSKMPSIKRDEIVSLLNLFIQKLETDAPEQFTFNTDYYWIIATDEWGVDISNPTPIVGSLVDDIAYLKRALEENAIYESNHFDRMATLFRAISESLAPLGETPV